MSYAPLKVSKIQNNIAHKSALHFLITFIHVYAWLTDFENTFLFVSLKMEDIQIPMNRGTMDDIGDADVGSFDWQSSDSWIFWFLDFCWFWCTDVYCWYCNMLPQDLLKCIYSVHVHLFKGCCMNSYMNLESFVCQAPVYMYMYFTVSVTAYTCTLCVTGRYK